MLTSEPDDFRLVKPVGFNRGLMFATLMRINEYGRKYYL